MFLWRGSRLYVFSTSNVGDADPFGLVEEVDPITLSPVKASPRLPTGGHVWCGSMFVHANGDLYVMNGRFVHRLSPDLDIVVEMQLPDDRPYHGMLAMADGAILTKELRLTGEPSHLTLLDPQTLTELTSVQLLEPSLGRLCGELVDGSDLIYAPGTERIFRYEYRRGGLKRDAGWTARYRTSNSELGVASDGSISMGSLWVHDNNDVGSVRHMMGQHPVGSAVSEQTFDNFPGPSHVHRFGLVDAGDHDELEPIGTPNGWATAGPIAVEEHSIVVGYDTSAGILTAWDVRGDSPPRIAWAKPIANWMQPLAFADTAELVVDDYQPMVDHNLVVLDLLSGEEKGRVATGASTPSGTFACPGQHRDLYYPTFNVITRVFVTG